MTTKKKNPTGSRRVELCQQARALYRTVDAATQELAEVVSEIDEEASEHNDGSLESVWRALEPVQLALESAMQGNPGFDCEVEITIATYLKKRA